MTPLETARDGRTPGRTEGPADVESLNVRRRAHDGGETPARRRIPAEDLEPIVRRAAELQNRRGSPGAQSLTEAEVIEIGRQVGLEPDYVRRAIAEVHAESLSPQPPTGNLLLDMLAGAGRVEIRRVVAGDPALIQQQIEVQLRDREKLGSLRRRLGRSVWEASSGTFARLERFLNFSGREYALAEIRQVDLSVAELEPGWSLVTIAADIGNKRDGALYGVTGGVAAAGIVAFLIAAESAGGSIVVGIACALLVGLPGAAVGLSWLRWNLARRRERIGLLLEGLVDRAEQ
ncbi:MAG TPA: hypothetical protein VFG91_01135 [Woeseiaceae bacterium]|nr:hypothetical protein [Woeseiaceae bacterium]